MEQEMLKLILVEMRELKGDMSGLKGDMSRLKSDMSEMKVTLKNVEGRLTKVEKDISEVKSTLKETYELAEFNKETSESIRNVVTNHYMEFKKFVKANNTHHNLYNAKLLQYNKKS